MVCLAGMQNPGVDRGYCCDRGCALAGRVANLGRKSEWKPATEQGGTGFLDGRPFSVVDALRCPASPCAHLAAALPRGLGRFAAALVVSYPGQPVVCGRYSGSGCSFDLALFYSFAASWRLVQSISINREVGNPASISFYVSGL